MIGSINFQLALGVFMAGDTVQQHYFIKLFIAKIIKINIRTGHGKGCAGIAVLNSFGQRIFVYHILNGTCLVPFVTKGVAVSSKPKSGCRSLSA